MDMGWRYLTAEDKRSILRGIRDGKAYGGPYHVEIYPADRCNIDCFFCSTAAIRGTDELPLDRMVALIDEMKAAGTRAIRFAGGGEPMFHRKFKEILRRIVEAKIPIENITTNAVLMDEEMSELLTQCCDMVTVSLNTADGESYASMMQTPARNFERVLKNVRNLARIRRNRRPVIDIQFLVWRDNYKTIPRMYELARELGADTILFNGLSFLPREKNMSEEQIAEMLALYEEVVRVDEFRVIRNISSFERDITPEITAMIERLAAERRSRGFVRRAIDFVKRSDFTLAEKLRHRARLRENVKLANAAKQIDDACVIGWYSMVVRSTGEVAPCCILQAKSSGNIFRQPLAEIWRSEAYDAFRGELSSIIRGGAQWLPEGSEKIVDANCGKRGTNLCPMRSFYYLRDEEFIREVGSLFQQLRDA
ncbi:MAG TPA: radical SAM protein [Thermoanaerobaculia bacterium]|nr:radical SAM protein [Thermoanaerobaculia bacterium]